MFGRVFGLSFGCRRQTVWGKRKFVCCGRGGKAENVKWDSVNGDAVGSRYALTGIVAVTKQAQENWTFVVSLFLRICNVILYFETTLDKHSCHGWFLLFFTSSSVFTSNLLFFTSLIFFASSSFFTLSPFFPPPPDLFHTFILLYIWYSFFTSSSSHHLFFTFNPLLHPWYFLYLHPFLHFRPFLHLPFSHFTSFLYTLSSFFTLDLLLLHP